MRVETGGAEISIEHISYMSKRMRQGKRAGEAGAGPKAMHPAYSRMKGVRRETDSSSGSWARGELSMSTEEN
jgi:hypothetical protein